MINNKLIIPIYSYLNADTQKKLIYLDNKGKTGIYRWTNIISGKSYVGSSIHNKNLNVNNEIYFWFCILYYNCYF